MRGRTRSACVVLAWGIVLTMTAVGFLGALRPSQANIRIASNTSSISRITSNSIQATLTSRVTRTTSDSVTGASRPSETAVESAGGPRPASGIGTARYAVQPGDTLSGIAAATGVRGGWPALYAANRDVIGPDPGLIRPGTILTLPVRAAPDRYTVPAGGTLSGIAAAFGRPGGWPALYAANRQAVGPDPNAIRAGMVLVIAPLAAPRPAASGAPGGSQPAGHPAAPAGPSRTRSTSPGSAAPASARPSAPASASAPTPASAPATRLARPASARPAGPGGLPRWLEVVLLAAGLLIVTAFLTEPTLAIARRLRATRSTAADARIILADYDRLVVTHSGADGTVYVLRPPGSDPEAILLAARLVLAQDRYEELAGHLGVPAHWPRE